MITKISKNIQKNILRSAVRRAAMSTEATLSSAETEEKLHDVPLHMSNSEAFVETMVAHGVTVCTGIGSAFMDTLDPSIRRTDCLWLTSRMLTWLTDTRAGKARSLYCLNGPGVSNFPGIARCVLTQSGRDDLPSRTATKGLGGFQELDQMPVFEAALWAHVNNPARIAELSARAFDIAMHECGPVQINIPETTSTARTRSRYCPRPLEHGVGASRSLDEAARLIAEAKNPVILAGKVSDRKRCGGSQESAEYPVSRRDLVSSQRFSLHHPLACGPLGYQGHKLQCMRCMKSTS